MRTAIALLLLAAGASVLGTVIKQNASQQEYIKAYGRIGYAAIRSLNLDDVYHSAWYILLLLLLSLNLIVCTARRFSAAWRRTFAPRVVIDQAEMQSLAKSESITTELPPAEIVSRASLALKNKGYRVRTGSSDGLSFLYAVKGRLGIWGPYITHLSVLVVFVGAVIGGFLGSGGTMIITEGESAGVYWSDSNTHPVELGFVIHLRRFEISTDDHHRPTAYRSWVEVREDGKPTSRHVIDVNRPLAYKGVAFYQSSCGLDSFILRIESSQGKFAWVRFDLTDLTGAQDLLKTVDVGGKKIAVYLHNAVPDYVGGERINGSDLPLNPACDLLVSDRFHKEEGINGWTRLGWLQVGDSVGYKGWRIKLAKAVPYTVLDVSRNPGLPIVYVGFVLVVVGVFLSFYVPHRELRLCAAEQEGRTSVTIGCPQRALDEVTEKDMELLRSALSPADI
ncbi:MAG: cytochrome c biogenesis protein ResB [Armatimonadota bacterium]|nr:cytochrome c biogenesis protein ResB [Armatimonadota bacterium]